MRIDQEPLPVESGKPPAYWPSSGNLRVEKLSASYSDGEKTSFCLEGQYMLIVHLFRWSSCSS